MSLNRYKTRKDANHKLVTAGLRKAGVKFWDVEWPCDLIAAHKLTRHPVLLEIKANSKKPMTEAQQELRVFLAPSHFYRVETVEQALSAVGAIE